MRSPENNDPAQQLINYGTFLFNSKEFEEAFRRAGFEVAKIPKYPYPRITLSCPEIFEGEIFLRQILLEALNGNLVPQPPTYVDISFDLPFHHPDGSFRAGFNWAINRPKQDTLVILSRQIERQNSIKELALAWGSNPFDIEGEVCDVSVSLYNLAWYQANISVETVASPNLTHELARRVDKSGISQWLEWAYIYPKSESDLFARLTLELAKRAALEDRKTAALVCVDNFPEDTYDKENGVIVLPESLNELNAQQLVQISKKVAEEFGNRPFRG